MSKETADSIRLKNEFDIFKQELDNRNISGESNPDKLERERHKVTDLNDEIVCFVVAENESIACGIASDEMGIAIENLKVKLDGS